MPKLIRRISQAGVVFATEQSLRCSAPFYRELATELAKVLNVHHIGMRINGEQSLWQTAHWTWGKSPSVRVITAAGNEFELNATVEGDTSQARDVLLDLWAHLGDLVQDDPTPIGDVVARDVFQSITTVRADETFERKLQPFWDAARLAFEAVPGGVAVSNTLKIEIPIRVNLGAIEVDRSVTIERRMLSTPEQRLYHVSSPLRTEDHDRLLEGLFGPLDS